MAMQVITRLSIYIYIYIYIYAQPGRQCDSQAGNETRASYCCLMRNNTTEKQMHVYLCCL